MARHNAITREKFSDVKLLLQSGFSIKKAADIAGVSYGVACKVNNNDTYEDYRGIVEEKKEPKTVIASFDKVGELADKLQKMSEKLEQMNETLGMICDIMKKYMEV